MPITANRGNWTFIAAALLFTALTLMYSLKGGLRSLIFTDVIQAALFVGILAAVLFVILPKRGTAQLLPMSEFKLAAGTIPASWAIGSGKYALLLGTNLYGLAICFTGFLLPLAWQRVNMPAHAARP